MDSYGTRARIRVGDRDVEIRSLPALDAQGFPVARLPYSLRVLLENLLRHEDGTSVTAEDIAKLARWSPTEATTREIAFSPARVVLQDFTGVPALVDLAGMRDAMVALGGDARRVDPQVPVELVIDHSIQVDAFGSRDAFTQNEALDYGRNRERYAFLRWGQRAFRNLRVTPPNTGIVHQVNLEHLARVVFTNADAGAPSGTPLQAWPDTLVGTDSHTPMVNGLGVLGWGVGGIEAEACMLGQPLTMLVPRVVGVRLTGGLREGVTATDLVLTVTEMLRKVGVVGAFVEFFGPGVSQLSLADRATIGNMSPEYGATCAIFPPDAVTLDYLRLTGRPPERIALVEAYMKEQGLFLGPDSPEPLCSEVLTLDLASIEPSLAGPRRPQDRVRLSEAGASFRTALPELLPQQQGPSAASGTLPIDHGSVVIAAITSCTNTSNPSVMMAAGILARNAAEKGLTRKPWVKTSLAPGSKVVSAYYAQAGLTPALEQLGFHVVGYGCTTCIGNSGPLPTDVSDAISQGGLVAVAVLSGNRNFEGRIHAEVRANYLASPPLVVAYALAGRIDHDFEREPLGEDKDGHPVFLKDIWPTRKEVQDMVARCIVSEMYRRNYAETGPEEPRWAALDVPEGDRYRWEATSTYVRPPPWVEGMARRAPERVDDIVGARALAWLGDSVTTDHISPAGSIRAASPAGKRLVANGVPVEGFNSSGARRGNQEVMVRG
ncbi:MAG: aconitate hydratase AcnA, partial [Myxococcota bacterium]